MPLFKKTDPRVVTEGVFASWPRTTQAVYHVISQLANYESGLLRVKRETLGDYASVSLGSVDRGLARLEAAGKVRVLRRTGRGLELLYVFGAAEGAGRYESSIDEESEASIDEEAESSIDEESDEGVEGSAGQVSSGFAELGGDSYKKDPDKRVPYNNVWLPEKLYRKLASEYGESAVEERVVLISRKDGNIRSRIGYLVASLKGSWLPAVTESEHELDGLAGGLAAAERTLAGIRNDEDMRHFESDDRWEIRSSPEEMKADLVRMWEGNCAGLRKKIAKMKGGGD